MADADSRFPYFQYVQGLTKSWPQFQLLVDFASHDERVPGDQSDRLSSVNVQVIDIPESIDPRPGPISTRGHLEDCLAHSSPQLQHRVLLCEGLSKNVIEVLGATFKLDPRFFENHLRGHELFLRKWPAYNGYRGIRVDSALYDQLQEHFITLKFLRPYPFRTWAELMRARLKASIPRLACLAGNFYIRESISFYKPFRNLDSYDVSIIICDPLLDIKPLEGVHLRNRDRLPQFGGQPDAPNEPRWEKSSARHILAKILSPLEQCTREEIEESVETTMIEIALDFFAAALTELDILRIQRTRVLALRETNALPQSHRTNIPLGEQEAWSYKDMLWELNGRGGIMALLEELQTYLSDIEMVSLKGLPLNSRSRELEKEVQYLTKRHSIVQSWLNGYLGFLQQEETANEMKRLLKCTVMMFFLSPFSTVATVLGIQDFKRISLFIALVVPIFTFSIFIGIKDVLLGMIYHVIRQYPQVLQLNQWRRVRRQDAANAA